jgi:cell division protein FtsB
MQMFDFHQKRKLRTIINSRFTQGFILFLALWVGWSAFIRYEIAVEMSDRREVAQTKAIELEAREAFLSKQVEYLSSDRGMEAEMRRQFDMALPGEQVVVIVEKEDDELDIQPLSSSTQQTKSKWYQFWD